MEILWNETFNNVFGRKFGCGNKESLEFLVENSIFKIAVFTQKEILFTIR